MKKLLPLLGLLALAACANYGKKVSPKNSKGEVFYKGEGVNEADAQKLADYLQDVVKYFDNETRKSVQLKKAEGGGYDIRFVVDEKKVKAIPDIEEKFAELGGAVSIDLFGEQPVNVILTDDHFKEIKSIPFDKEVVKRLKEKINPPAEETTVPEPVQTEQPAQDTAQ